MKLYHILPKGLDKHIKFLKAKRIIKNFKNKEILNDT